MSNAITIKKRGVERVRQGHLWIYRSDLADSPGECAGATVRVLDARGRFVAKAFCSSRSEIALRVLSLKDEEIGRDWWRARLRAAHERRRPFLAGTDAYRLVYSEADLLSSLIVDVYGGVFVIQTLSQGADAVIGTITELLVEEFGPAAIAERNDVRVRELEGLPLRTGVLHGAVPEDIQVLQDGVRFLVSPLEGQKTGLFLDQRENYGAAKRHARGRALDCFTFNGGFALHIAPSCESVLALDISGSAVSRAQRNAALNEMQNVTVREANVFDALREFDEAGERFDTVVLDPPAFAKNRKSVPAALRGYKEINLRALRMLSEGGILVTCTCSYHMSEAMFLDVLREAAADAHRRVQLLEKRGQAADHPVLLSMPETAYLKCMILRVVA